MTPSVRKKSSLTRAPGARSTPAGVPGGRRRPDTPTATKTGVELLPVEIVGIGQIGQWKQLDGLVDADETRRLRIRERPDQRGIDERKDRNAGTDAERQREDRRAGEPERFPKLAKSETDVLQSDCRAVHSPHVAAFLFSLQEPGSHPSRDATRFVWIHPARGFSSILRSR